MKALLVITSTFFATALVLSQIYFDTEEILIESLESKTDMGANVYNKIKYIPGKDKDVWLMSQNHTELKGNWDELKIEVDKTSLPYKAYYSQMKNGKEIDYRVSCFTCHANGPRAIRPNYNSKQVSYSLKDKVKVFLWNMKIKHYGEIETPQDIKIGKVKRKIPLRYEGRIDRRHLNVKTCNYCHGDNSFMGRKALELQQAATIRFLVSSGMMPPAPFSLSQEEKDEINNFLELN